MYRRVTVQPVGMSGVLDSIANAVKGVVSGITITAPPITLPSYQIPGTVPPSSSGIQTQSSGGGAPDWLLPAAIGGAALLGIMMFSGRRR